MYESISLARITDILDVFEEWRTLGCKRLPNGTELIGRVPDGDSVAWMHVLFPKLSAERIEAMERQLRRPLPRELRQLYRTTGAMSLFGGAFHVVGMRPAFLHEGEAALQPVDLVAFNHELECASWKSEQAIAFALNSWDHSIHVMGGGGKENEIWRMERGTGMLLERHADIWDFLSDKLHKLDQILIR